MTPSDLRYPIKLTTNGKLAVLLEINRAIAYADVEAAAEIPEYATIRIAPLGAPNSAHPNSDDEYDRCPLHIVGDRPESSGGMLEISYSISPGVLERALTNGERTHWGRPKHGG